MLVTAATDLQKDIVESGRVGFEKIYRINIWENFCSLKSVLFRELAL